MPMEQAFRPHPVQLGLEPLGVRDGPLGEPGHAVRVQIAAAYRPGKCGEQCLALSCSRPTMTSGLRLLVSGFGRGH